MRMLPLSSVSSSLSSPLSVSYSAASSVLDPESELELELELEELELVAELEEALFLLLGSSPEIFTVFFFSVGFAVEFPVLLPSPAPDPDPAPGPNISEPVAVEELPPLAVTGLSVYAFSPVFLVV